MRVTIRDVAHAANVSISTVSRVLNDTCVVSEDKRLLVLEAAKNLNYRPNPAARSLLNKSTGGLGVLLPFVSGEFFSEFLGGIDEAAQKNDFFLMISTSHRHQDEFRAAMRAMDKRVDGLIIMAPELGAEDAASIPSLDEPVVFVNTNIDQRPFDVINFDNFGGAHALTRHLLELGHHRIAHIKGPADARDAQERTRGYRMAMAESGIEDVVALEFQGGFTQESGHAAANRILQMDPRPSAIMAANDYSAMGVLSALHEAGISVPKDVAVAGFDGLASGQFTVPPLTSVRVPVRELGSTAVIRLIDRLHGKLADTAPLRLDLPVELLIRESTSAKAVHGRTPGFE